MTNEEIGRQLAPMRAATIAMAFVPPADAPIEVTSHVFSGFGVECVGNVFWVTAAHVLKHLYDAFEAFPESRLFLKGMNSPAEPIPFRRDPELWTDIGKTLQKLHETGELHLLGDPLDPEVFEAMDIGIIQLPDLYVAGLKAVGFQPLPIDSLSIPTKDEFDAWREGELDMQFFVSGALAETVERSSPNGNFSYTWSTLPIDAENWDKPKFIFTPLWTPEHLNSGVKGMSGGPIAMTGFKDLHIVAVQSAQWINGRQIPEELWAWDAQFVRQIIESLCAMQSNAPEIS